MSYANHVQSTLNANITAGSTSIQVVKAVAPYQDPPTSGYVTLSDSLFEPTTLEIVSYTGRTDSGSYWTLTGVIRGLGNTTAASFTSSAIVYQAVFADDIGSTEFSSQPQAETGTDNTTAMTPLRVRQSIVTSPLATESVRGVTERSTQTEAETGTDNTTAMTPLRVRQSIVTSPLATTSARGVVEKSTQAENDGGTVVGKYPDVEGVKRMIDTHAGGGGGGGGLLDVQYFTSSGTWNKPADTTKIEVICVGGGGAGGVDGTGGGRAPDGSDTSFGTLCIADAGVGGLNGLTTYGAEGGRGGNDFNCTGDFSVNGGYGEYGYDGAKGGTSYFGGIEAPGCGGSGVRVRNSTGTATTTGGGGGAGAMSTIFAAYTGGSQTVTIGSGGSSGSGASDGNDGAVIVKSYA